MHFTEDKERYEIIKDIPALTETALPERHVLYLATPKNKYCPTCRSALFSKGPKPLAPFNDCINGTMYKITVYKKRLYCEKCHRVHIVSNHPDFDKRLRARNAALKTLVDQNATMSDFANQGGFSKAAGSKAIKNLIAAIEKEEIRPKDADDQEYVEYIKKLRDLIKTFHTENVLAVIPFKFSDAWRCLICTWDARKNDAYLLDVLDSNELKEIQKIKDRVNVKTIRKVFCDANDQVIASMSCDYVNAEIMIGRRCMTDALIRYRTERNLKVFSSIRSVYQALRRIIENADPNTWNRRWDAWRESLTNQQEKIFEDVLLFVDRNVLVVDKSFHYRYKAPYSNLLNEIKKRGHLDFETLRMQLLFTNHAHYDKTLTTDFFNTFYRISSVPSKPIHQFGVRIFDLVSEMKAEREPRDVIDYVSNLL